MTINIYSRKFNEQISWCYLEAFKMTGRGSVKKSPENSNIITIQFRVEMLSMSLKQLDKFIDCVIQAFPPDTVEKVDTNLHFLKSRTNLCLIVTTKIQNGDVQK